jgi:hypothetical protein
VITIKLALAVVAFVLSSGQIVFQSFQHHHALNPKHGAVKLAVFLFSLLSLIYLGKDIYADFEQKKIPAPVITVASQVELDYWHQIYSHPSPEHYCDYLEKFPIGQFVDIARNGVPNHDCLSVKRQLAEETRKKAEAEAIALQEKFEHATQTLIEKNARLEQEARENAARIAVLEHTEKTVEIIQTPPPPPVPIKIVKVIKIVKPDNKYKSEPKKQSTIIIREPLPTLPVDIQEN